jgi:hypothetical protein
VAKRPAAHWDEAVHKSVHEFLRKWLGGESVERCAGLRTLGGVPARRASNVYPIEALRQQ